MNSACSGTEAWSAAISLFWRQEMKIPWTDKNAWAEEDHGDFWMPRKPLRKAVTDNLWLVALAVVSLVVWVAIRTAVGA